MVISAIPAANSSAVSATSAINAASISNAIAAISSINAYARYARNALPAISAPSANISASIITNSDHNFFSSDRCGYHRRHRCRNHSPSSLYHVGLSRGRSYDHRS